MAHGVLVLEESDFGERDRTVDAPPRRQARRRQVREACAELRELCVLGAELVLLRREALPMDLGGLGA